MIRATRRESKDLARMSLATIAKDFERLAKKARTVQQTRRLCIDAVLQELESAKAALEGIDNGCVGVRGGPDTKTFITGDPMEEDHAAFPGCAEGVCGSEAGDSARGASSNRLESVAGCEHVLESLEHAVASAVASDSMASDDKEIASMSTKLGKVAPKPFYDTASGGVSPVFLHCL